MPIPAYPAPTPSTYPKTLPNPSVSVVTPGERRLPSDLSGGPEQVRGIERDYKAMQDLEWGALDATQAAALNTWWTDTLTQGGAWFASTWPSPQGWVQVTRRFQGALQWTYIPGGFWRVSAKCIVRGVGLTPTVPGCIPWVQAQACPPVGVPVLFGSASCITVDPLTGYIWAGAAGGTVNVFDPLSMTLLTTISIGSGAVDGIEYRNGFVYVSSPGNSFRAVGDAKLITQIDAVSHAIVSGANSSYFGGLSILGMLSQDQSGLYMSIVGGLGAGTGRIASTAPFVMSPGYAMSDGVTNYINNPFSGVLAYTGYSVNIDLRGAVTHAVDTTPYYGASGMLYARLVYQTCTNNLFVINTQLPGILRINTLTGVVTVIDAAFWSSVIYYSPESDTLYVEGSVLPFGARTVRTYQATTLAFISELPTYTTGATRGGRAIYLGCESFIVNNALGATEQMWRVSFPH